MNNSCVWKLIVLKRYCNWKVVIVFFQHQKSPKVSVVIDTFWRYFCEASCHDWSSNLSLECAYLRVRVFIRTCTYVYLRDVLEWFSLMRTPNIPTLPLLSEIMRSENRKKQSEQEKQQHRHKTESYSFVLHLTSPLSNFVTPPISSNSLMRSVKVFC